MDSFVIHKQYLECIPEEEKGKWLLVICNYGLDNIEPTLDSWLEKALWSKIKFRIDHDRSIYCKRVNNLKQNKNKTDNIGAPTEPFSVSDNNNVGAPTSPLPVGLNVYDNVNVNLYDNVNLNDDMYADESENVEKSESENVDKSDDITLHCTTVSAQNINNTTVFYGFTLTPRQQKTFLDKIKSFSVDVPSLINFICKKTKSQYEGKPLAELKKLYVNALTKYPDSFLDEFNAKNETDKKNAERESKKLIYFNPPSRKCSCGAVFEPRPDVDEKTNISYTAFKCPECNTMLTCEGGKWTYSQGVSDIAIAAAL